MYYVSTYLCESYFFLTASQKTSHVLMCSFTVHLYNIYMYFVSTYLMLCNEIKELLFNFDFNDENT